MLIGLALLVAAALLVVLVLRRESDTSIRPPLWDNFFDVEQSPTMDYRFSWPRAGVLLPDLPPGPARLEFRAFSPQPLPPRMLNIRYDTQPVAVVPVDATPRVYHLLLPSAASAPYAGLLIGLETSEARIAEDERPLGLLFDYSEVTALQQPGFLWLYVVVAVVFAGVGGILLLVRSGWLSAGAIMLLLAVLLLLNLWLMVAAGGLTILLLWLAGSGRARRMLQRSDLLLFRFLMQPGPVAAAALLLTFASGLSYYSIVNYETFGTNAYDLGVYNQSLWLINQGLYPYNTTLGLHALGTHAALLLYPLSAIYWIVPHVHMLLIVQSTVIALGIVPIYLIARAHGNEAAGVIAGAAYLLHPAVINMTTFDFHPDTLATTALLFALWAIDRQRWPLVVLFSCLVLFAKENFAITIAFLGLWLLAHKEWRTGGVLLVAGAGWFVLVTQIILPSLIGEGESLHLGRFSQYGDSIGAIIQTFISRPGFVLAEAFRPDNLGYLWQLFLPFLFLPLLSPRYLVLGGPALALNLLSNFAPQQTIRYQYNALFLAVASVATVYALLWLSRHIAEGIPRRLALAFCALLLLAGSLHIQQTVSFRISSIQQRVEADHSWVDYRRYVLSHVPAQASVSAQTMLQPHLSSRPIIYLFPNPFRGVLYYDPAGFPPEPVDYVVYDVKRPDRAYLPVERKLAIIEALQERGLYRPVVKAGGVLLLQRVATDQLPPECFGARWQDDQCRLR